VEISIVGLGWLGEPLARFFQKKGYPVKGSTTSREKAERLTFEGIVSFPLQFNPLPFGQVQDVFVNTEVLVINIPPNTRATNKNHHISQIRAVRVCAEKYSIPKLIFVSATSVYPSTNQIAEESDVLTLENTDNPVLLEAENLLWKDKSYDLTVVRLGGLLGDDRIPGKYFSNKENVPGDAPVNYIYRNDAVRLLDWIIEKQLWNQTFNGVAPMHPSRREVYELNAKLCKFPPPLSYEQPTTSHWKEISSKKIIKTGFVFDFHPLNFPCHIA